MKYKDFFRYLLENTSQEDLYLELIKDPVENNHVLEKMVNSAAKKAGYDIGPVYHGTVENFTAFDNKKTGKNDRGLWGLGHYFTTNKETSKSYASRQGDEIKIFSVFIKMENPMVLRTGNDLVIRMPDGRDTKSLIGQNLDGSKIKDIAMSNKNDGIIQLKTNGGIGDLVVYSPEQIKSSDIITYDDRGNLIPLSKRFDTNNKDIRY